MSEVFNKTLREFLKENKLSVGDNAVFLFRALGIEDRVDLKRLEEELGEVAKMSKSKANTVDPESVVERYGADTVRLYVLFAAPPERDFEWIESGIEGAHRFLNRLWDFVVKSLPLFEGLEGKPDQSKLSKRAKEVRRKTHRTIKKFAEEMEKDYQFNTAIAAVMELLNEVERFKPENEEEKKVLKEAAETMLKLLYPITPHVCEELWEKMGKKTRLYAEPYPEPDEEALKVEEVEIPVQVNGKVRAKVVVPVGASQEEVLKAATAHPSVAKHLEGKELKKVVYVPNRLINLVVK
ncbi:MAG: class I tRNA ligase family protein [Aquificae bacterium]|nr:class I tRNA ligase family protein [Aquificota bacterium]